MPRRRAVSFLLPCGEGSTYWPINKVRRIRQKDETSQSKGTAKKGVKEGRKEGGKKGRKRGNSLAGAPLEGARPECRTSVDGV